MNIELLKFSDSRIPSSYFKLADDSRCLTFIKQLSKECNKGNVVIYALNIDSKIAGFIGVAAAKIDNIPAMQIEYIFVNKEFRKITIKELDSEKVSSYLMGYIMELAKSIKNQIGLKWLILTPDNDRLQDYYKAEFGFVEHKKMMYLKIPKV